jgi:hypothetical protein
MQLIVYQAIVLFLQKPWGICNAYEHGTTIVADVFESTLEIEAQGEWH